MRPSPAEQAQAKIGLWKQAFDAVAEELTPVALRSMLATLQSNEQMRDLPLYIQLARLVAANDRAAATVAAIITATGIKPTAIDYGDDA
jgi:hypothetical protein